MALFEEPEGWTAPEKPCTYQTFTTEEKNEHGDTVQKEIKLRLVGSSPLWVCLSSFRVLNVCSDIYVLRNVITLGLSMIRKTRHAGELRVTVNLSIMTTNLFVGTKTDAPIRVTSSGKPAVSSQHI